jgi:hypothetical protein
MCIKHPFPRQVLKDIMLFYKEGLEGMLVLTIKITTMNYTHKGLFSSIIYL